MRTTLRLALVAVAAAPNACEVGPDYVAPDVRTPGSFDTTPGEVRATAASTPLAPRGAQEPPPPVDLAAWWKSLRDPELDSLLERAIDANLDLRIAAARLQEVRSIESSVSGAALPSADFAAGAARSSGTDSTRGRIPGALHSGTDTAGTTEITHVAGFDASWEIDLFGKLRREAEVLHAESVAALERRDEVLVTLLADVARTYVEVRSLQMRLGIGEQMLDVVQKSVDLAQAKLARGIVNELDVVLAQRQLATVRSRIAPLQAQLAAAQRRVAVLLGGYPEELRAELVGTAPLPVPPTEIATGIPSDLLRRRPDVRAAESDLVAANARIGVATALLYPEVVLTGAAGWQGQGLGRTPVTWNDLWSVGPSVRWPLLDFGTLDALVRAEDFRTRESALRYRRAIILAIQEVDNALTDYDAERTRLASLTEAVQAGERALDLANRRYDRGLTDFLNVLDAQRQLFDLEDQYAVSEDTTVTQFIAVCKALGGGWEGFPPPPPPGAPRPAVVAATADALSPPPRATDVK